MSESTLFDVELYTYTHTWQLSIFRHCVSQLYGCRVATARQQGLDC